MTLPISYRVASSRQQNDSSGNMSNGSSTNVMRGKVDKENAPQVASVASMHRDGMQKADRQTSMQEQTQASQPALLHQNIASLSIQQKPQQQHTSPAMLPTPSHQPTPTPSVAKPYRKRVVKCRRRKNNSSAHRNSSTASVNTSFGSTSITSSSEASSFMNDFEVTPTKHCESAHFYHKLEPQLESQQSRECRNPVAWTLMNDHSYDEEEKSDKVAAEQREDDDMAPEWDIAIPHAVSESSYFPPSFGYQQHLYAASTNYSYPPHYLPHSYQQYHPWPSHPTFSYSPTTNSIYQSHSMDDDQEMAYAYSTTNAKGNAHPPSPPGFLASSQSYDTYHQDHHPENIVRPIPIRNMTSVGTASSSSTTYFG